MTYVINPSRFAVASDTMLLDEAGLGSAAGAFSVARQLRSAYTGSAFQARRFSDGELLDIGFDANGDMDESALTTFAGSGRCDVKILYDQSGNGRDVTQATDTLLPVIVDATGTVYKINGKPAMYFDGSDRLVGADDTVSSQSVCTLYSVAYNTDGTNLTAEGWFGVGIGSSAGQGFSLTFSQNNLDHEEPCIIMPGGGGIGYGTQSIDSQVLGIGTCDGTAGELYVDNGSNVSKTFSSTLNILNSRFVIGTYLTINYHISIGGYFQEGVGWFSDKTSNLATLKSNANSYYSIW